MARKTRRGFLKLTAGGALAANPLPGAIARALAVPATRRTGTIADVEHIVVFMQENRSFDHYFGHLRGVRGYNDRFPIPLPDGRPVWFQPRQMQPDETVLPFHLDTGSTSAQCLESLDHGWTRTHSAIDGGRYGRWPSFKTDMTMGYHQRADIPFHYALADGFTVCDQYFCSLPGPTHPNRMYLMTGMVDPTGTGGGPQIDNNDIVQAPKLPPLGWTTYPERLEAAGISWQVYQQGLDLNDDFDGNYGLNVLANFRQFIEAPPNSPLRRRGLTTRRLEAFTEDVRSGRLPQVSWLLPPAAFSEHPHFMPAYGANYTARILDALTANPEVWSKTVLLVMYDENDGFFDHVPPPQPPTPVLPGKSTVATTGEIHDRVNPAHRRREEVDLLPYGLGPRVPMTVVSPWSKGGFVCSQVFDHTSVIRFIEARFGVMEPNISPWRRAVCGDLTSALDFATPDQARPSLPDTGGYRAAADENCRRLARPVAPGLGQTADSIVPQEPGTRPARALPYDLAVTDRIDRTAGSVTLQFVNTGAQGAHFLVYASQSPDAPRRYTVEAGKSLDDTWPITGDGYTLAVYGPNGFFRRFAGGDDAQHPGLDLQTRSDKATGDLVLRLTNPSQTKIICQISDRAYGAPRRVHRINPGETIEDRHTLGDSGHWYDLAVTVNAAASWLRILAGHVETGHPSISDPAATAPMLTVS
ncbi:MAG TPA: phospholipase C, phosphocholine-specific [Aliidongia sp.]|uniref:phosphocholine-specific phospholipase C n=1 Tax=Aliidongia sp. TaxID=1914230 RepID=UPI002DDD9AB5|nr:phospholipase C, phosphocholine-specific [Aliidongia sp.]HEV2674258.1 phospholipase C, phosphocholine-specific [Aliidongia sp.]